jgi:hypothetical protein
MANNSIDPIQAIHSSAVARNVEAVDSAQRELAPVSPSPTIPKDRVTISPEARAQQSSGGSAERKAPPHVIERR